MKYLKIICLLNIAAIKWRKYLNITCLLLPSHDCVADSVRFFNQNSAFYTVGATKSHDLCLNVFLSQAVDLFYLR